MQNVNWKFQGVCGRISALIWLIGKALHFLDHWFAVIKEPNTQSSGKLVSGIYFLLLRQLLCLQGAQSAIASSTVRVKMDCIRFSTILVFVWAILSLLATSAKGKCHAKNNFFPSWVFFTFTYNCQLKLNLEEFVHGYFRWLSFESYAKEKANPSTRIFEAIVIAPLYSVCVHFWHHSLRRLLTSWNMCKEGRPSLLGNWVCLA